MYYLQLQQLLDKFNASYWTFLHSTLSAVSADGLGIYCLFFKEIQWYENTINTLFLIHGAFMPDNKTCT